MCEDDAGSISWEREGKCLVQWTMDFTDEDS